MPVSHVCAALGAALLLTAAGYAPGAAGATAGAGAVGSAAPPVPGPAPVPVPGPGGSAFGAFLGSGPEGIARSGGLQDWLGGAETLVGHTYLPGDLWSNIRGRDDFLRPWAEWRRADEDRIFVLNVPMLERNEAGLPDAEVAGLLDRGAGGAFDHHFRALAERLVRLGLGDAVLVLGWEMNGTTYTHRCAPDPEAWRAYWRRIVGAMREVPGQRLRFDFAPSRGLDAIAWDRCYPGDDVVDIVGMDSYDQPPGASFEDQVEQPYGLAFHASFAAAHGKPISFPEWGLYRRGDNPEYVRRMLAWIAEHRPVYHTISDYCPHGVWRCAANPASAEAFREALAEDGAADGAADGETNAPGSDEFTAPAGSAPS